MSPKNSPFLTVCEFSFPTQFTFILSCIFTSPFGIELLKRSILFEEIIFLTSITANFSKNLISAFKNIFIRIIQFVVSLVQSPAPSRGLYKIRPSS